MEKKVQQIFSDGIDIKEDAMLRLNPKLFDLLLQDQSSGKHILWATSDYASNGDGFQENDEIKAEIGTKSRNRNFVYNTPLLLGIPFTVRLGETAIATARAKALKIDSRQWWLSLP